MRNKAQRLIIYIQTYRSEAWEHQPPSRERNELLRLLQMVQGKIMSSMDQQQEAIRFVVSPEESAAIQMMVRTLATMYGRERPGDERHKTLVDLARLTNYIKQQMSGTMRSHSQTF